MMDFNLLEKKLGVHFKSKKILEQAFTHRSYLNEKPHLKLEHNERLEFLGDAVLELVVTEHLYNNYPEKPEGEMTNWRAALVNAKMLSALAKELDFNDFLLLSRGEAKETGKARQYILANAFEAFVGALYLDQGYEQSEKFIKKYLLKKLPEVIKYKLYRDVKSYFQEQAQEKVGITPSYKVVSEFGPDHKKKFTVGVYLGKEPVAKGEGYSKQEAEEEAARQALLVKHWDK